MKNRNPPPIKCMVRNLSTGGCLISIPADSMQEIRNRLFSLSPEEVAETLVQNLTDGFCGAEYNEPVALFNLGDWDIVNGEYRMSGDVAQENMRKVRERNG